MTTPFIGGRGKTAPYATTHCRIPKPIKPIVEVLINRYKDFALHLGPEEALKKLTPTLMQGICDSGVEQQSSKIEAIKILSEALSYRANAGGKIKESIRQAIKLLEEE